MGRPTPMDHAAAGRVSAAAPQSPSKQSGFDERAQAAADRNDPYDDDDYDDE